MTSGGVFIGRLAQCYKPLKLSCVDPIPENEFLSRDTGNVLKIKNVSWRFRVYPDPMGKSIDACIAQSSPKAECYIVSGTYFAVLPLPGSNLLTRSYPRALLDFSFSLGVPTKKSLECAAEAHGRRK